MGHALLPGDPLLAARGGLPAEGPLAVGEPEPRRRRVGPALDAPEQFLARRLVQGLAAPIDRLVRAVERQTFRSAAVLDADQNPAAQEPRQEQAGREPPEPVADPLEPLADRRVELRPDQDVHPLLDREVAPR